MCIIFTVILLLMFSFAVVGMEMFAGTVSSAVACTNVAASTRLLWVPLSDVEPLTASDTVASPPFMHAEQAQRLSASALLTELDGVRAWLQALEAEAASRDLRSASPATVESDNARGTPSRLVKEPEPRFLSTQGSNTTLPLCDTLPAFVDPHVSFDNFVDAVLVLFQMVTTSNWHEVMYTAMWATGSFIFVAAHGSVSRVSPSFTLLCCWSMVPDSRFSTIVYFLSFYFFTVTFMLNLVLAIYIDSYGLLQRMVL